MIWIGIDPVLLAELLIGASRDWHAQRTAGRQGEAGGSRPDRPPPPVSRRPLPAADAHG